MTPLRAASRLSCLLILVAYLAPAKAARAEDPRQQQADAFYREAVKLHDKGLEAEALEKFRQSYATYPSPAALNSVARLELLLGRDIEAVRHFRQVLANPLTHPQTAQRARENIQELEGRLGRLKVQAPDGTVFVIDGERYLSPVVAPIDVKPGEVRVEGTYGDARYEGRGTAVKGNVVSLELVSLERRHVIPPAVTPTELPSAGPAGGSFWGWRSVGGLALVGAGAVAIVVGVAAKSEQSSQEDKKTSLAASLPPGAQNSRCFGSAASACSDYRDARSARDSAEARANTWLPIGVGVTVVGAALVASAALWPHRRLSSSAAKPPRIIPIPGRTEAGLVFVSDF